MEDSIHLFAVPAGATYQITSYPPKTTLVAQGYFQYLDTKLN
nr:hypothetical protein [Escherichia coli]